MKNLFLIDGNAIFYRAYHSMPPFRTQLGMPTNAIYGFVKMFFDILDRYKPDHIAVAWDRATPTYRDTEFKDYKANRPPPPPDLYPQLPKLKEVINAFGIPSYELDGYEADDIIASIANEVACKSFETKKNNLADCVEVRILTGDRDSFQLVNEFVQIIMPVVGFSSVALVDREKVIEKMGVPPEQIVDYKALCGDQSDNIPGVAGIGPKQAVELLKQYQTLENIYSQLPQIKETQRKKLETSRENAFMSQSLARAQYDAKVNFNLENCILKPDYAKLIELFQQLESKSLVKKAQKMAGISVEPNPPTTPKHPVDLNDFPFGREPSKPAHSPKENLQQSLF